MISKILKPYIFIGLCAVFHCFHTFAQKPNLKFEHIGTESGLSHSNVACILHDSRGFMWFGGEGGLARFNGERLEIFQSDPARPQRGSRSQMLSASCSPWWCAAASSVGVTAGTVSL